MRHTARAIIQNKHTLLVTGHDAGFTPQCFPKRIGDYQLGGITRMNLFRYEL